MMRFLLAATLAAGAAAALAQLRTIPAEAQPGVMRHVQTSVVELDGKPAMLSPGAQIRDADNRLVLPVSLAQKTPVMYLRDGAGMVHRVWILSPRESAK